MMEQLELARKMAEVKIEKLNDRLYEVLRKNVAIEDEEEELENLTENQRNFSIRF